MKQVSAIVAMDEENGIGKKGKLPWHISEDLKWFKEISQQYDYLVIGGNTYRQGYDDYQKTLSLPGRDIILLARESYGLNRDPKGGGKVYSFKDARFLLQRLFSNNQVGGPLYEQKSILVCGGAYVYDLFLPYISRLYLTRVKGVHNCDTHFSFRPKSSPFVAYDWYVERDLDVTDSNLDYIRIYEKKPVISKL